MRLLDSKKYIHDLKKAVDRNNLSMLHGKVPSRFMRKIVCRLRLNEVSRQ